MVDSQSLFGAHNSPCGRGVQHSPCKSEDCPQSGCFRALVLFLSGRMPKVALPRVALASMLHCKTDMVRIENLTKRAFCLRTLLSSARESLAA